MTNLKSCVNLLKENDEKIYNDVCNVLSRLCRNVIKHPNELKYRKVRLSNPIVAEKILPAVGAMECLFEIGFVEGDDHLLLPETASISKLEELESLLSEPQAQKSESRCNRIEPTSSQFVAPTSPPIQPPTTTGNRSNIRSPAQEAEFFSQIQRHFQDVLRYENKQLKDRARGLVPLVDLQIKAMENMRLIQRDVKSNVDNNKSVEDISLEDLLFVEVLRWFKEKFFQWVDSPECTSCSGKCTIQRTIASSNPGVSRIEIYRCGTCATIVEFPRYTDPALLLYSRKGRCGEWANTFALICRSLGYDTRLVWDYTDHVWVEIWSVAANRWIHADPCENVTDRPLMYEKGWGKELSYIIAFSKDEIQDVTWRYTADQKALMKRRNLCSEQNLQSFTSSLTENRRRTSCSLPRQQFLIKRSLMELVEFISSHFGNGKKNSSDKEEYEGRTSGSLAWRLARHETTVDPSSSHIWQIPTEVESVKLSYTASSDKYTLVDQSGRVLEKKEGWGKGVCKMDGGIFRKVETDWKMVYLARSPENDCGNIEWSFEVTDSNYEIEKLKFRTTDTVYQNAKIEWKLQGFYRSGKTKVLSINDSKEFETEQIKGAFKANLSATLSGGDKNLAWQHAQLFRQSLNAAENSMEVDINLGKIS